jgi:cytoskeletal protein RodZ
LITNKRVLDSNTSLNEYREGDESLSKPNKSYNSIILILFLVIAVFGLLTAIFGIMFTAMRRRRNRLAAKGHPALPSPSSSKTIVSKHRNASESESANMSLLSNHSESSTAPSTNCSSEHSGHSETTPLTSQQPRLTNGDIV